MQKYPNFVFVLLVSLAFFWSALKGTVIEFVLEQGIYQLYVNS